MMPVADASPRKEARAAAARLGARPPANIFFRLVGEVLEWIHPHQRHEAGAGSASPQKHAHPVAKKSKPRRAQSPQRKRRSLRHMDLRDGGIWIDDACVGEFVWDSAAVTPDFVFKWARHSRNLQRYIRSLRLPAEFTWYYVDIITVHAEWRGHGIARAVFDKIAREHKPVLIMLVPQQTRAVGWGAAVQKKNADDRMSQVQRLAVYRDLGFDEINIKNRHFGKATFAFRWIP